MMSCASWPGNSPYTEPIARGTEVWVENRPRRGFGWPDLREVWAYRELTGSIAVRDIKVRYKQTLLGVTWAVGQPLIGTAVMTIVFHRIINVPGEGDMPYAVFAYVGYIVWSFFSSGIGGATVSLVHEADLVTKVYFPRLCAPLAAVVGSPLLNLAVSFLGLAVLLPVAGVRPHFALITLPLWLAAALVFAVSVGAGLAVLNVAYRDVGNLLGPIFQLWFFLSPVAYPESEVPDRWRELYAVNPMVGLLDGYRWALAGGPAPGGDALISLASAVVLGAAGLLCFHSLERRLADIV